MKLFDLHCDTPSLIYKQQKSLRCNDLHVSLEKATVFEKYVQCAAVWSASDMNDCQCFDFFINACDYFEKETGGFIKSRKDLENTRNCGFILAVEDARLISHIPDGIDILFKKGVRVLTLLWAGASALGNGWDSFGGLTRRGSEILEKAFDIGIIPDISHANDEVCSFCLERTKALKKPVIATHSNSRAVCPHLRNLTDENAKAVAKCGGIIGISLFPPHLNGDFADISHITAHIKHYINTAGEESVCLGCDFDGIGSTPEKINSVADLPILFDAICACIGYNAAERIFFNNAYNFFINNLP